MADFEQAIERVLKHEGGYANDPDDPGGETKYGISKRQYPNLDIATLTLDQAKAIYRRDYWKYDGISDQAVASKLFDMAVNLGAFQAHRLLQRALNRIIAGPIVVDGEFGAKSLEGVNAAPPTALLLELRAEQAVHYANLVMTRPVLGKFLLGWMRRAVA